MSNHKTITLYMWCTSYIYTLYTRENFEIRIWKLDPHLVKVISPYYNEVGMDI